MVWVSYFFVYLGLGKLAQAEEYLAKADWTVLKTPDCPRAIKSKLYRNLGLLNAAKGEFHDALTCFADDVGILRLFMFSTFVMKKKTVIFFFDAVLHLI